MNVQSATDWRKTLDRYFELHVVIILQILILVIVDSEHSYQVDYHVLIERHGLHIFIVDFLKASLVTVNQLLQTRGLIGLTFKIHVIN
jgi:hypothetical protein